MLSSLFSMGNWPRGFVSPRKMARPRVVGNKLKNYNNKPFRKGGKLGQARIKAFERKKKNAEPEEAAIQKLQSQYASIDPKTVSKFTDFPLSNKTLKGLKDNHYVRPTEIQRESIGPCLQGSDILGAAKTGSGKTLAFLIPVLENLYCKRWTKGVGALIITPTRELAYQINETLQNIGKYHDFSASLVIGGFDYREELKCIENSNIVISTPGRLLQHIDVNPTFFLSDIQVLVLDEADRCLDMGFEKTMNSIFAVLPTTRQTILFSATQTKSVKALARLSLKDPVYISVHEHAKHSTPEELEQSYMICELEDKISVLYSFIKNHIKQKSLVFLSCCKQVKYIYDAFCHLRPGISLLALHGDQSQKKRLSVYESFCKKSKVVMFATDLAARGLDFPGVHWVVQLDCPEDPETYIHRVGRTARLHRVGASLLILLPSEKAMLKRLEDHKIPLTEIMINPSMLRSPTRKLEANLAHFTNLKDSAQRAFVGYFRFLSMMKDKEVFKIDELNMEAFARSLGLSVTPRVRFLDRKKKRMGLIDNEKTTEEENEFVEKVQDGKDETVSAKKKAQTTFNFGTDENDVEEDDVLTVKRRNHDLADIPNVPEIPEGISENSKKQKVISKVSAAKRFLKKNIIPNTKVTFDEEGKVVLDQMSQKMSEAARQYEAETDVSGIDVARAQELMREEDRFDKQRFREKVKAKHREARLLAKAQAKEERDAKRRIGKDESESESDDSGPDLSWLPDPDKVYGPRKNDNSEEGESLDSNGETSDNEDYRSEEEPVHRPPKRKLAVKETVKAKHRRTKRGEDEEFKPMDTGLSLLEDEELALKFLQRRN